MEVSDAVTSVSLDELTIDLSGDQNDEEEIASFPDTQTNNSIDILNGKELDFTTGSADKYILNPGVQAEETKTDTDVTMVMNNVDAEADDFEVDVPPLDLFPSSKQNDSDDSDSEFEVPERTHIPVKSVPVETSNREPTSTCHQAEENTLREKDNFKFQPEILTPRENHTTDFTLAPEDTSVAGGNEKAESQDTSATTPQTLQVMDSTYKPFSVATVHVPHISEEDEKNKNPPVSAITTEKDNTDLQKPDIITTAEDWEGVETVEPGFLKHGEQSSDGAATFESKPLLAFAESWKDFESKDYSSVKGEIRTRIERKGFSAFTHLLFGPPKLNNDLISQRDLIFCIAATPFNNDDKEHVSVLQSVYRCLTGSKFDCQRYGSHWEEIGFQGRDPATDLRGAGMLALLHLLYFLRDPFTKDLARDVYKLSLHPTQNFPFCVMGINLTRNCIQVLREEIYNRECNKRKDVIGTLNNIYAALFLHLFKLWKQGKTIADSGFVLKEVETHSRKHAKTIFKELELYNKMKKQQGPFGETAETEPTFFSVCKEDQCDAKSTAELY